MARRRNVDYTLPTMDVYKHQKTSTLRLSSMLGITSGEKPMILLYCILKQQAMFLTLKHVGIGGDIQAPTIHVGLDRNLVLLGKWWMILLQVRAQTNYEIWCVIVLNTN